MLQFTHLHPRAEDFLGLIPNFLSEDDPRSAAAQFAENYSHGGGWSPMTGWRYDSAPPSTPPFISYPGDPPYYAVAKATLRDETILVFPHAWVAIVQSNGDFEVSRMD